MTDTANPTQQPTSANAPAAAPQTLNAAPAGATTASPTSVSAAALAEMQPVAPVETPAPAAKPEHKSAVAYLENAMNHAIATLDKEGVAVTHGIGDELRALKSFIAYQMHALKGKLHIS